MNQPVKYDSSETDLDRMAEFLHARTGLRFNGARRRFLMTRVSEAVEATRCASIGALLERLREEDESSTGFQQLLDCVLTDESSFFRYPQQYEALRNFILPAIANNRGFEERDPTIRILSAGCARGQEPYSIAMVCEEEQETLKGLNVVVYALDISTSALERAREGIYLDSDLRDVSAEMRERYFTAAARNGRRGYHQVADRLKEMVRFQQRNLKDELSGPIFDVIFCRNVTIYFDEEDTRRVALNLYKRLVPGGYLFLGHAESYYGILPGLLTLQFGEALVNRKPVQ